MQADPDSGDEGDGCECRNRGGRRNEQQERNRRERPRDTKCLREASAEPDETEKGRELKSPDICGAPSALCTRAVWRRARMRLTSRRS
jgi:hypothetical protein